VNKTIITYESDNSLKKGYLSIFSEIFIEIKKNRWLTYQLFKRDFFAIYKQSFIGVFWAFIIPLVSVGTFIILNRSGVFNFGEIDVPYPIFAILGMSFWQLFATGLVTASNSLVKAGPMIIKINFLLFPLLVIPIMLFTLGLGFILSLLNGVVRDIGNALAFLITFLMFLTPILYAKPKMGILQTITKINPLYYLVSTPRELILMGTISEWRGFLITSTISIIIFIMCLVVFHLTETRVAERI